MMLASRAAIGASACRRADRMGGVRPLNRFRKRIQVLHRVEAAGERERLGVEQPLEYLERLRETVDADARRIISKPAASTPGREKPAPSPSSNRPPDRMSSVATSWRP